MEISMLSQKRGIMSIYDGKKYIIYSTYYGVVAKSTSIERVDDENYREKECKIVFDICDWIGYWSLKDIINRGIRKLERQFLPDKKVEIEYNTREGEQMYLKERLVMDTEKY